MRTLEFTVKSQRLKRASGYSFNHIIMGSKNFLRAHFTFDESWVGLAKVALFSSDTDTQYVALKNDECMIPDSVTESKSFDIQVIGVNGDQKAPTNVLTIRQEES